MTVRHSRRAVIRGATAAAVVLPFAARRSAAHSGVVHEVRIERFRFAPARLEVRVGDHVRWTNHDLAPHTATADDASWDTGELRRGESAEIEVTDDMVLDYFCALHPRMTGELSIA